MTKTDTKTHYKKAFDNPYLSSADIDSPMPLTIKNVALEKDKTNKTKKYFNTAYFKEKEIRPGELLKPMVLNVTNCKTLQSISGSPWIDDWKDILVTIYVESNVKFGKDTVDGLRISAEKQNEKPDLTPDKKQMWDNAITAYVRDGNFDAIEKRAVISNKNKKLLKREAENRK